MKIYVAIDAILDRVKVQGDTLVTIARVINDKK